MADRKAELERKKQKLEQMRKERQEKERIRKLKEVKKQNKFATRTDQKAELDHSVFTLPEPNPFLDSVTGPFYYVAIYLPPPPPSVGGASVNGNIIKRPRDRIQKGINQNQAGQVRFSASCIYLSRYRV